MLQRCTNKNNPDYHHYGGRGITVCAKWIFFVNFFKDMGDHPRGLSIKRIDNDKGYYKENCKWATQTEQTRNVRLQKRNKTMKIRREWAMPNKETFKIPPIGAFVEYYLKLSKMSVDPFARNFQGCTYTNDLNPKTKAKEHMKALDFLKLIHETGVPADLIVFDPPYSTRQIKECYHNFGLKMSYEDTHEYGSWKLTRNAIAKILKIGGVVLSFGWNTIGMGTKRGFNKEEILLVCHGGAHNDTICMAERKTSEQLKLF
jgi:hypothetical protein